MEIELVNGTGAQNLKPRDDENCYTKDETADLT